MKSLRENIEKMIDDPNLVESMLENLGLVYEANQVDPNDAIERAVEAGRNKKLDTKSWTKEVFYDDTYDNLTKC
ncbi:hypothetical protein [Parasitella parasitica]|uniref:Uncharacterized protein n=1 Tax=Parasitella parasitica TaxID=35722 RepID=A0A0B7NMC2_9FUNG|nr:hypothetical protein [Parasitella parasitica]